VAGVNSSGIVYVDSNNSLAFNKAGANKTITYSGTGSLLVTGQVQMNTNMVTSGNASFRRISWGL